MYKKLIFGIVLGLVIFSFNVYAGCTDGEANCWDCSKAGDETSDCTARLKDGTLTLSGTGSTGDYSWGTAPWSGSKNFITKIVVEDGITRVGSTAFYNLAKVTEIKLADSIKELGSWSFRETTNVQNFKLPKNLETIGGGAFVAWSFDELEIPSTVESIGTFAFASGNFHLVIDPNANISLGQIFENVGGGYSNQSSKISCKGDINKCAEMVKTVSDWVASKGGTVAIDYYIKKDKNGNIIEEWGPNGKSTYKYDSGGNVVAKFGPNGERLFGKKFYTIQEANEATPNPKGIYSVKLTW